jgi:hypothetical protein
MEEKIKEYKKNEVTRASVANKLIEKWAEKTHIMGKDYTSTINESNLRKNQDLVTLLQNVDDGLSQLTETQISNAFGQTPETVQRIIRLGYPNTIRGDIFHEWAASSWFQTIYYWSPIFGTTARGGVQGEITHQSASERYASEIEKNLVDATGSTTGAFTGTTSVFPLRPYKATITINGQPVARDNGAGVFIDIVAGTLTGTNTINYTTGAYEINFLDTPQNLVGEAVAQVDLEYFGDWEVASNYGELGEVQMSLNRTEFRQDLFPVSISVSKQAEMLLATTLNLDVLNDSEVAAADLLRRELDFRILKLGYNVSKGNILTEFDADVVSSGEDSTINRAKVLSATVKRVGNNIYNELNRGGVTAIYGGSDAVAYLTLTDKWQEDTSMPMIGGYKAGTFNNIPVFQVPSSIVPVDELVTSYRNEQAPFDVGISIGNFYPLMAGPQRTQRLEYKNIYSEWSVYTAEDVQVLQPLYIRRLKLKNLDAALGS